MTIELNEYGLMLDLGDFIYLSLSWAFLILSALVFIGYKVYRRVQEHKWARLVRDELSNDEWGSNEQTTNYTSAISAYRSRPYHGAHDVA